MSGVSLGSGAGLPDLQKINLNRVAKGANNSHQTIDNTSSGGGKLRKASPEALALMMANIKKNDPGTSHSSQWAAGGPLGRQQASMVRDNSRTRKLFY